MDDEMPQVNDLFDDIFEDGPPVADESESTEIEQQVSADAEFMGEKGGVVTGRGRMEAAFGSGDGDETATAQVAQVASEATGGTLFHQVYRPWRGQLNTRWVRNWAILRYHIYGLFSKGHKPWPVMTKLIIFGVLILSISDLAMLAIGAISGEEVIERISGISRGNLYGHVLSFWFRNACTYPIVTALIIGGMISEDRRNGTSALYFSRPINRRDYAAMKFLSVALILSVVVLVTLSMYYLGAILVGGEGWSYVMDTGLLFVGAFAAGVLLVFTYTSIGLALSSVSSGKFFPAVAFIGIILGTKLVSFLISSLFNSTAIYLISPFDCLAHVGQWMLGVNQTYEHPASWSLVMLLVMNAVSLYVLTVRVSSLEVTRE
ncbi:MAG: ABC transporter permease [Candidatus Thalassarchaeaceae archaeon]|jgi:ABC-type transport system involved in multi-copper enzyme maturation permease subunit|nr:ABC transporter permease [Candidatus Thalassarchaeaceae archaeon]MDP7042766.1 ABC transporter permease [Candidatus Thalassarchaeaceae archaeon]